MLKGKGTRGDREVLIFGLSFENLKRLKEDKPIVIWREEMGIDHDVIIFAGPDEAAMAEMVRNPDTIEKHMGQSPKN